MADEAKKFKPTDFDQLYPGRFIKAGDLAGKRVTVTISDVEMEEIVDSEGKPKMKGVLSFQGKNRGLVLNKTNGTCIKSMFGKKLAVWVGKRITLFNGGWNGDDAIRIWGSPDIEKDTEVEVALPRRKPIRMTLRKTTGDTLKDSETNSGMAAVDTPNNEKR